MIVIFLLIPLSIVIATGFLLAFIWAVRSGQYEDTCTPSMRLLLDEQYSSQSCARNDLRALASHRPSPTTAKLAVEATALPGSETGAPSAATAVDFQLKTK